MTPVESTLPSAVPPRALSKVMSVPREMVSVAEDLSYMQIAYMEDREISENMTVMEYVN